MKCAIKDFSKVFCVSCIVAVTLFDSGACLNAQGVSATPAFEVATIKPAAPFDPTKYGPRINLARASYTDWSLKLLIAHAYDINLPQVSGPEWISSVNYDIVATLPEGVAKEDEKRMLQALLKERFGLAFHIEKREGEIYALIVGKHGSRLQPSPPDSPESDPNAPLKPGESYVGGEDSKTKMMRNKDGSSTVDRGKDGTETIKSDFQSGTMHRERSKITMEKLAEWLPGCLGAGALEKYTVVDQTGIKGNYQVALAYPLGISMPKSASAGADASDPQGGGSLNQSLDALGLKLEKRKAPIDVYVVDHAEKPSAN